MKLSIIAGSHRAASQSARVARFIEEFLRQGDVGGFGNVYTLDLASTRLALWGDDVQAASKAPCNRDVWNEISANFRDSGAFVVVTPEWGGMVPPGLKNLFLHCSGNELSHKPALIVAVSAGDGGAYPVAELRATSSKNTKLCYIPEHVIIRRVKSVLNGPEPQDEYDRLTRVRLQYSLKLLFEYSMALTAVRASGVIDHVAFPYGM